ncbi:hypothetical protein T492DRAFT_880801 [Pavlovales sp. CCMP2436]|nr:hypothetical protein T492DRAFT_880801 [Pavlovales sp. CCMP2436]
MDEESALLSSSSGDEEEGGTGEADADADVAIAVPPPVHEIVAAEAAALHGHLAQNPRLYDAHTRLIQLLCSAGDVAGAREAREAMSAQFPLAESLWRAWIADEKQAAEAASGGGDGAEAQAYRGYVLQLYARAAADYLSPSLWLERAFYLLEADAPEADVRASLEDAVMAAGAHVLEGGR